MFDLLRELLVPRHEGIVPSRPAPDAAARRVTDTSPTAPIPIAPSRSRPSWRSGSRSKRSPPGAAGCGCGSVPSSPGADDDHPPFCARWAAMRRRRGTAARPELEGPRSGAAGGRRRPAYEPGAPWTP